MIDRVLVVIVEQMRSQFPGSKPGMAAQKFADGRNTQIGMTNKRIDLKAIAGAEDRSLQHLLMTAKRLKRGLHGLLRDAEPFPDLHRCRAMTEADDGNVHGDSPFNRNVTISSERCSGRRP